MPLWLLSGEPLQLLSQQFPHQRCCNTFQTREGLCTFPSVFTMLRYQLKHTGGQISRKENACFTDLEHMGNTNEKASPTTARRRVGAAVPANQCVHGFFLNFTLLWTQFRSNFLLCTHFLHCFDCSNFKILRLAQLYCSFPECNYSVCRNKQLHCHSQTSRLWNKITALISSSYKISKQKQNQTQNLHN